MDKRAIIKCIDDYLTRTGKQDIGPVEANALLERAGLLRNSDQRPGKPLRDILRKGMLPHAYQSGGKGSSWIIPKSVGKTSAPIDKTPNYLAVKDKIQTIRQQSSNSKIDLQNLKEQLDRARQKYKPEKVKYLLIAEAPPDSIDRFFYYEDVRQHDYLFIGVAKVLYPELKEKFITSGRDKHIKESILKRFQEDGFYLLDLSDLPLSLMSGSLDMQIPSLLSKVSDVASHDTKIILFKASVYDTVFVRLLEIYGSQIINCRIYFPGQGGQTKFQVEFSKALKLAGHK